MKRKANYELLRIVAIVIIMGLHYLDKGGILPKLNTEISAPGYLAWFLEAFFLMGLNTFVLLSGYFGLTSTFRIKKVLTLWGQILFYSMGIAGICILFGLIPLSDLSIYRLFGYIFPISTHHYWFASGYLFLFFLMPLFNAGIEKLEQRQLQGVMLGLFVILCLSKTIIPMHLPWDTGGYDADWLMLVYIVGGYIRKYGRKEWQQKGCLLFFLSGLLMFGITCVLHVIWQRTGALENFQGYAYSLNHLFCLTGSVGLFLWFGNFEIKSEKLGKWICEISGCTFGVYLIHEHMDLRYLWPQWFQTPSMADRFLFVPHMMVTILVVFSCCALIEYLRKRLFSIVGKKLSGNKTV